MAHALRLLGFPQLNVGGRSLPLDRRTAAVLAYLAIEGESPKYKLAGMLWPDSGEGTARNNMRQLLRRLRLARGDIIRGEERISLEQTVVTDVAGLSSLDLARVLELPPNDQLLEGFDYDDTPDFADWLEGVREELATLRLRALEAEADRLEALGQLGRALERVQLAVKLEPLSEASHRRIMRLHYLLGDRAAALSAFGRCRRLLGEELGTEPLPETLELARLIERGTVLPSAAPKPKEMLLPTAILRPPILAGRDREWALMEEAWEAGKLIILSGEPGSGKTRLAEDFAASKGKLLRHDGRPGDSGIPYATVARNLREGLKLMPELSPQSGHLSPWVWGELARILPEFGEASSGDKLRFLEAINLLYSYVISDQQVVISDDLQFYDDSSLESALFYQSQNFPPRPGTPRFITVFRTGELSEKGQDVVGTALGSGIATLIEVTPLQDESVEALVKGMGLENTLGLAQGLTRYTGGNPMFILETLKHLIETDTLALGLPPRLAPPEKVATLITRRLGRLSAGALKLARVAAVAGTSFEMRLAAFVLERPALELAEAHAELEGAQMLRSKSFTHDLVFETVLAGTPKAVAQALHARTAQFLETTDGSPALIAQHWLESGDERRAAPWLLEAARNLFKGEEAATLYGRAADIFERQNELEKASESRVFQDRALHGENADKLKTSLKN